MGYGNLLDKTTQLWVKLTGKRIDPEKDHWLLGPIGSNTFIGDSFIEELATKDKLETFRNQADTGLLYSIKEIGLDHNELERLNPMIAEFYEKTSNFNFEIWSEWIGMFKPFGRLLSILFSKRLQQLNLPLSLRDTALGIQSEIITLKKPEANQPKWVIWYRKLKSSQHVIYSGVYTTCQNPNYTSPLLKVVFPLPNGNASVVMTHKVLEDGSLLLSSDGKQFGDNGFYFTLANHKGKYWARYVKSMHEWIKVYVDQEGVLRADHNLHLHGFRFLSLHYKMTPKT